MEMGMRVAKGAAGIEPMEKGDAGLSVGAQAIGKMGMRLILLACLLML